MTLEGFRQAHDLPQAWYELRKKCEQLAFRPDFWYQAELMNEARKLASQASDILSSALSSIEKLSEQEKGR